MLVIATCSLDSYSCHMYYVMSALGSLLFPFLAVFFLHFTYSTITCHYSIYLWSVFCTHINSVTYTRDFFSILFIHMNPDPRTVSES